MVDFEAALQAYMKSEHAELMEEINNTGDWNDDYKQRMSKALENFQQTGSW